MIRTIRDRITRPDPYKLQQKAVLVGNELITYLLAIGFLVAVCNGC